MTCPKRYYYRFIEKLPWFPSAATSFGSSIHNTIYHFLKSTTQDPHAVQQSMFPEELEPCTKETLLHIFDHRWIETGYESRSQMIERKKIAIKLLSNWFEQYKESWEHIFQMEKSFSITIHDKIIKGRFDRIDKVSEGLHIIDYKTGKLHDETLLKYNEQLQLYAIAAEQLFSTPVARVSLYFFEHDTWQSFTPDHQEKAHVQQLLATRIDQIEQEDFSPLPEVGKCAKCPYASFCHKS